MRNNFWLMLVLIIFLITLGTLVYYIRFKTSIAPRASGLTSTNVLSTFNSYVFASPVRAKANGDLIRITVFLLDEEGNGVFNNEVSLQTDSTLSINEIQSLTDDTGKAIFDISSPMVGSYIVKAMVGNIVLDQDVKVVFD